MKLRVLRGKKLDVKNIDIQLDKSVEIFASPYELAENFAEELISTITESAKKKKHFSLALSGGSTPELLFSVLGDNYSKYALWEFVHFFWGDERCVSPDHPESNYGMTLRKLFEKIEIPFANIHRIKGEDDPEKEAFRYSEEISDYTGKRDGLPLFDQIILGLGEDGHTASIFPGQIKSFNSDKICEVAVHPVTLQKRITLTGRVINNADSVAFLVTGKKKAGIIEKIFKKSPLALNYPAYHVIPVYGVLRWFIDEDAGRLL
ncbi:MAG: 6-phosphogluconolactonase [Bacteroidia bacterium]|nr:6-phosphogluconolactonase [Bacteroidia bacterium]